MYVPRRATFKGLGLGDLWTLDCQALCACLLSRLPSRVLHVNPGHVTTRDIHWYIWKGFKMPEGASRKMLLRGLEKLATQSFRCSLVHVPFLGATISECV